MTSYLEQAHAADIRMRTEDEKLPVGGIAINATDVTQGVVYEHHGVRVVHSMSPVVRRVQPLR